jgi:predicted TIM-barrel fold metal-dependent hydrolase
MVSNLSVERVLDVDSHEMIPDEMREEYFGHTELHDVAQTFGIRETRKHHANQTSVPGLTGDVTPINHDTVWNLKGPAAPSAIDMARRPEVLDAMGIERQLVYPTFGLMALLMFIDPQAHAFFGFDPERHDRRKLGREGIEAHNRWATRTTQSTSARARPVGIVLTDSVDDMMRQTEQMLADGIRALMIPANTPPAGTSPADPALDPFWCLAADANVPVTIHLGTEFGFLSSTAWSRNVEVFNPSSKSTLEFVIEPLRASTMQFCAENFVTAMVLGGVFERHPHLHFGVIELGACWVGPLAERLDMWVQQQFSARLANVLSMRPSDYIARNVRVTPFHFEPVAYYLERYPNLTDVFCYSSDYPHFEGGKESKRIFSEALSGVSPELRDKFFFQNATLLLPE